MSRWSSGLAVVLALPALLAAGAGRTAAQTVVVTPAPVVRYYYAPPAVSYSAPPAVTYYAPPTVTTYQYGLLPRRRVTVTTYGPPAVFAPAPVVRYYRPVYVWP
jgi:hypothetical protein